MDDAPLTWIATAAYGLEGVLAGEVRALGYETADVQTSRVAFKGGPEAGIRANLWLRTAGRVRLQAGSFEARDFNGLFDRVSAICWEDYLPRDAAFPVACRLVNSDIVSPSDTQAIVKKAVASRLCRRYGLSRMPEDGLPYPIEAHIHRNLATLSLDSSGEPLHRRGYRVLNAEAALRETMAAALVLLSGWSAGEPLADPFCGSGTICVEAAMIGRNIAPGLRRSFASESWPILPAALWARAREEARDLAGRGPLDISGGDIDDRTLGMARTHARRAGIADAVRFASGDARKFSSPHPRGAWVTNPPYGRRLSGEREAERLLRDLAPVLASLPGWSFHILSAHPRLEALLGRGAYRRRALRNGPIPCRFYEFGPLPGPGSGGIRDA